ncbi:MAG: 5-oxoprolinase subunit PxpB [Bacteroidetes bacterium]|nr:5-oxoprolinase subunit PxpB [Bacteroidota bacterium]MBU1484455.1 5-oxoprolinase subunit PxpB [Bacteroidota bacterium]MBU2267430.1 5-oxoprolinase subunit PxpB [Bacteroidota bacterium]MBU2375243.1 5-oxoprolinase subunit PxpB [Bacteroidota bacterium]
MASIANEYILYPISEKAVSIEFGNQIDEEIRQKISHLNQRILREPFSGFINTVPAYTTLTIFFEPLELLMNATLQGSTCLEKITFYLSKMKDEFKNQSHKDSKIIQIPVCYEDAFGLDLEELSSSYHLDKEKIITLHSEAIYSVYMIGFVPGFPYLGGLNELLKAPRKTAPRKAIPAGSVGIAGMQTGIYPLETPGGWQIIGRTPMKLFDVLQSQPSLLKAGDRIKFEAITKSEYERMAKNS